LREKSLSLQQTLQQTLTSSPFNEEEAKKALHEYTDNETQKDKVLDSIVRATSI
jgi:predicted RNase H-like nuclease